MIAIDRFTIAAATPPVVYDLTITASDIDSRAANQVIAGSITVVEATDGGTTLDSSTPDAAGIDAGTVAVAPDAGTGTNTDGGPGADATPTGLDAGPTGTRPRNSGARIEGGCSCSTAPTSSGAILSFVFAVLGLLRLRRRAIAASFSRRTRPFGDSDSRHR